MPAFGELERLINACTLRELGGVQVPDDLRPVHVTGRADTVSTFADALRFTQQ